MLPKVYVPHVPNRNTDLRKARRYGEIIVIFQPFDQVKEDSDIDHFYDMADKVMIDADQHDYILPIGDPALTAIVQGLMIESFGCLNLLKWNKFEKDYFDIFIRYDEV